MSFANVTPQIAATRSLEGLPDGVAVDEVNFCQFHNFLWPTFSKACPAAVQAMLTPKDIMHNYSAMVFALFCEDNTRNIFGQWKDDEILSIMDLFRHEFEHSGIHVALCMRSSSFGLRRARWIEFIDVEKAPQGYVSIYNVASNTSGRRIKSFGNTLEFMPGVAVLELKQYKGRLKLGDMIPIYVDEMLTEKDVMMEYEMLVDNCIHAGVHAETEEWSIDQLQDIIKKYRTKFEAKGVAIFVNKLAVCYKQEVASVSRTRFYESIAWIEFVDCELRPNYTPRQRAEVKPASSHWLLPEV